MGVQHSCPNLLLVLSFMAFSGWLDSLVHVHGNNVGVAPTKGVWSIFLVLFVFNYTLLKKVVTVTTFGLFVQ